MKIIILEGRYGIDVILKDLLPDIIDIPALIPYIKKYLVIQRKQSLLETIETHTQELSQECEATLKKVHIQMQLIGSACEEAIDTCISFFKNLGSKK